MPGPIEPIAKRGRSAVSNLAQAARATSAARLLRSNVHDASSSSNSRPTRMFAPKLSVSTMSAPTAR